MAPSLSFDATYERERAALLFANGKVYSAFTSYCDFSARNSRGWLLGWTWNGTTLTALPANQLNDRQPGPAIILDTIWMSGAGPASDESGNLLFATGNSAASTWTDTVPCTGTATGSVPTSVPCSNIQESVVKLKGDLTEVTGLFSPNAQYGTFSPTTTQMDQADEDLGAGGVLLVPQRGSAFFAAIAGKDGRLFLFDRSGTGLKLLQLYQGAKCFCAPSYFTRSRRRRPHRDEPRPRHSEPSSFQRRACRRREHQQPFPLDKTTASSPRFRATAAAHSAIARIRRSSGRFHIPHPAHPVSTFLHFRVWRQAGATGCSSVR